MENGIVPFLYEDALLIVEEFSLCWSFLYESSYISINSVTSLHQRTYKQHLEVPEVCLCALSKHKSTLSLILKEFVFLQQSKGLSGIRPLRMILFFICEGKQFYILSDLSPPLPGLCNVFKPH